MNQSRDEGDWSEYRKHLLAELERLNSNMETMNSKIGEMTTKIAILEFKSGLWGMLAGALATLIIIATKFIA